MVSSIDLIYLEIKQFCRENQFKGRKNNIEKQLHKLNLFLNTQTGPETLTLITFKSFDQSIKVYQKVAYVTFR